MNTNSGVYTPSMGLPDRTKFRQELIRDLRNELIHLKSFQIRIITFGLTGAGIFLGLIKEFGPSPQFCYFLPLIMVLPFWFIFFEKARTIARNIGFIRIQEKLLLSGSPDALIGFENAMHLYRSKKGEKLDKNPKVIKYISNLTKDGHKNAKKMLTSHYWVSTYIVFFTFSILCILMSALVANSPNIPEPTYLIPLGASIILVFIAGIVLRFSQRLQKEGYLFFWLFFFVTIIYLIFIYFGLTSQIGITALSGYPSIPVKIDAVFFEIYLIIIGIFNLVSVSTYWFFYNLVKGRYTTTIFELKWCVILDLDPVLVMATPELKDLYEQKNTYLYP
jgi:hypothetical protein